MAKSISLFIGLLLAGCQVGSTGPNTAPVAPAANAFPLLVHGQAPQLGFHRAGERFQAERSSKEIPALVVDAEGFLTHLSSLNLQPGKENTLLIRVSDPKLTPVSVDRITSVQYDMPTMPEMGGPFTATLTKKSDQELEATLDIAHGGFWEIRIHRNGVESFRIGVDVPKGKAP